MSEPSLVVLAAGRARRFGGLKPLAAVGAHGESVIDLIASDAMAAGFQRIVVVINPETGPAITDHVAAKWPPSLPVSFAIQQRPLGTVDAVLAAIEQVQRTIPFAVANADDLYGRDAMVALGNHLRVKGSNALVGFRLDRAVVGDQPVTRGVCKVRDGQLVAITERRQVRRVNGQFIADDGLQPRILEPSTRVSMNLWGFDPQMWDTLDATMAASRHASEDSEILLPDLVQGLLQRGEATFCVLEVSSRCIGVTHANDLSIVHADVMDQISRGDRPERAFSS